MTQAEIPVAHALPLPDRNPIVYHTNMISQPYVETGFAGTQEMALAWRLGKTVRFLALIDAVFCFLSFLQYPPLLIVAIFPLLGYYGAKEYINWKIYCYAFFVLINLCLRVYVYTMSRTMGGLLITILGVNVEAEKIHCASRGDTRYCTDYTWAKVWLCRASHRAHGAYSVCKV